MSAIGRMLGSAVMAVAMAGCAANNHGGHEHHGDVMAMTCPKCETTWVGPHAVAGGSSKIQAFHWGRTATCPDCDAMAEAYFKDGATVLHDCPTCKVTPQPANPRPLTPTHAKGTHG